MASNFGGKSSSGSRSGKRFGLQFKGWEEMITNLDKLSHYGAMEGAKQALIEAHNVVTPKLEAEIRKHHRTGKTESSLTKTPNIEKIGNSAFAIDIGFDLGKGGLPSIWLMHGTPKQSPDKALYDALYGRKTAGEIAHAQYHAIKDIIDKYMANNGG